MVWALALLAVPLILDGGFEGTGTWSAYGQGYSYDARVKHSGRQSIVCRSGDLVSGHGASVTVALDQKQAGAIEVSGWSRSEGVEASSPSDYSIYIDAMYQDGSPLWGQIAAFPANSEQWVRRRVVVVPAKPLKSVTVYALFRNHKGTAWFDDFEMKALDGGGTFDFQGLEVLPRPARPKLADLGAGFQVDSGGGIMASSGPAGGFLTRDCTTVQARPVVGQVRPEGKGLVLEQGGFWAKMEPTNHGVSGRVRLSAGQRDKAMTVYLALPIGKNAKWWDDARRQREVGGQAEFANTTIVPYGAAQQMSLYPWACVQMADRSVFLADGFEKPVCYRLFANPTRQWMVLAWDVAVRAGKPDVTLAFDIGQAKGPAASWGFRSAAEWFAGLHPDTFVRRTKKEGIWIPFSDPSTVPGSKDFGIAFHEGDNSVSSDDALGILSFRYTEPMTHWLPLPPETPRTPDDAWAQMKKVAGGTGPDAQVATATLNSVTRDRLGRPNIEIQNAPWCDGAVYVLNPAVQGAEKNPTKAFLNYNKALADRLHPVPRVGEKGLDGQYLDSIEGWSDYLDYSPENLAAYPHALTFDADLRPVMPVWFGSYVFAESIGNDLHKRGYLLMANATPIKYALFSKVMDLMGIETNWRSGDTFRPDTDATMLYRRTLSGTRPYLLLQNTDFDKFTHQDVQKYIERSLFYGIYPSMFSANAATKVYWENVALMDRDRGLFARYIPLVKRLSAAGWRPVTGVRADSAQLWLERFGERYVTALNASAVGTRFRLSFEGKSFPKKPKSATDLIGGAKLAVAWKGEQGSAVLELKPDQVAMLDFGGNP